TSSWLDRASLPRPPRRTRRSRSQPSRCERPRKSTGSFGTEAEPTMPPPSPLTPPAPPRRIASSPASFSCSTRRPKVSIPVRSRTVTRSSSGRIEGLAFKDIEEVPVPGGVTAPQNQQRRRVDFNGGKQCSLRFEAIDSLELHFQGVQQDDSLARAARETMLKRVGFDPVTFAPTKFIEVRTATPHPIRGYVITRGVDV